MHISNDAFCRGAISVLNCDCGRGCGHCDCEHCSYCDVDCGRCGIFFFFLHTKWKNKRSTTIVALKEQVSNIFDTNLCLQHIQIQTSHVFRMIQ